MLTCHLQLKLKSKTERPFLMYRLVVKIKHLPPLSTVTLFSVEFIHILTTFLPSTYKFGTVYTLAYRYLLICSSWTKLHNKLGSLKEIFLKNGYPEDFINKCFKKFLDNIHVVKETTLTVGKKPLVLVLPYLGSIPLQTRTKLKNSLKNINCCKLQIVSNNKSRLGNDFHFKDWIPSDLTSGVVCKFQCGLCNDSYYGECVRHLNVRIGEHNGTSPLTKKQVKPKNSSVSDHLLFCNHSASYDNFNTLTCERKKVLLKLKESLLIMRDKPSCLSFICFNSCYVILIEWTFFIIWPCVSV